MRVQIEVIRSYDSQSLPSARFESRRHETYAAAAVPRIILTGTCLD